jgi:hypothetical protein
VLESERAKERAVKKETAEQLAAFRKLRDDADRGIAGGGAGVAAEGAGVAVAVAVAEVVGLDWAVSAGRKRKAGEKDGLRGIKVRRTAKAGDTQGVADAGGASEAEKGVDGPSKKDDDGALAKTPEKSTITGEPKRAAASLGLAGYSSDEDEN